MTALLTFILAFFFSFIGSIPPGTINITVVQLGLEKRINIAMRLTLAAALIEYPYAWIAVKFEHLITSSPWIIDNINLLAAVVMTLLGIFNLLPSHSTPKFTQRFTESGFRRGLILGILNPLAIPYWIGVTAYLKSQHWIDVSTTLNLHSYLLGVSLGALVLLALLAYLAKKVVAEFLHSPWVKKIPGFMLLGLGVYAFIQYFI